MRLGAYIIVFLLISAPVSASYFEGKAGGVTYNVVDEKDYPVIFIPGVAGSELYTQGQNLWPGWLYQAATGGNFHKLARDEKGKSKHVVEATKSIRSGLEYETSFGTAQFLPDSLVGIYGPYFEYMEEEGYTEDHDDKTNKNKLYDFAYDWRDDNHQTARQLEAYVEDVLKETKSEKVILMAHSMGGVVARMYLKSEKNAKNVAGVIFMGTPHQGSPKPFLAFVQGYNFGNSKLTNEKMWEIMSNWEAGYQLLPRWSYVMDEDFNDWPIEKIYGTDWIGKLEYEYYMKDPENWELRYGMPNREYAGKVISFQEELGDTLDPYPWIQYYMIEGDKQESTWAFIGHLEDKPGVDKPVLTLEEVKIHEGDGTVPKEGAQVKGLSEPAFIVEIDHGSIPGFTGSHPQITFYREKINKEVHKEIRTRQIEQIANTELGKVQSWPDSGSVFRALLSKVVSLIIKPDEEKIKAREELRGSVKEMLKQARITVFAGEGDEQEKFYAIIQDYELVKAGAGEIKPGTAKVYMTKKDFEDLVTGKVRIADSYRDGKMTVKGVSVVNRFKLLLGKWFAKWSNKSNFDRPLNFEETLRMRAIEEEEN